MRVSERTLHRWLVGAGWWMLIGGCVGCWVGRFTTTQHPPPTFTCFIVSEHTLRGGRTLWSK